MLSDKEKHLASLINTHVQRHVGFAIYRLPHTSELRLLIQTDGKLFTSNDLSNLNSKEGFVIAPFNLKSDLPIIIVNPQIHAEGIDDVIDTLSSLPVAANAIETSGLQTKNISEIEYNRAFSTFRSEIQSGNAEKIVLARSKSFNKEFNAGLSFVRSCQKYPRMMVYLFYSPISGLWMGSTPEILVDGAKGEWSTMALAGTQLYSENAQWDEKNHHEQQVVESYIRTVLTDAHAKVVAGEPHSVRAGHLMHLRTDFNFSLPEEVGIGNIAQILHPTPAVCGRPREVASNIIETAEPTNRLYYSGLVGYISNNSNHLYVNLRCLMAQDDVVTVFAGGGIMPDSVAASEWKETEMKMDTMLNIIGS